MEPVRENGKWTLKALDFLFHAQNGYIFSSLMWQDHKNWFCDNGYTEVILVEEKMFQVSLTDKGRTLLNMLTNTPEPVLQPQTWMDPRE